MVVMSELDRLGLHYRKVELGEVDVIEDINTGQRAKLKTALLKWFIMKKSFPE